MPRRNHNDHDNAHESGWEKNLKHELRKQWESRYGYQREQPKQRQRSRTNFASYSRNHTKGTA